MPLYLVSITSRIQRFPLTLMYALHGCFYIIVLLFLCIQQKFQYLFLPWVSGERCISI